MNAVTIRKATLDHVNELADLFDAYRVFYTKPSDIAGARQFLTDRITNSESEIFISFSGTIASGFTQLYPLFSSTRMKRLWLLNDLYVADDFRGRGISVALIDQAKELCRQTRAAGFMLETAKSNERANKLYVKMGLDLDQEHNVYIWDVQ
jgi:ribosomal protein S18 acetylase RimI-like enzyme